MLNMTALLNLAALTGFLTGAGAAVYIMGKLLDKSNNKGDSKGEYYDFMAEPLNIYECKSQLSYIPRDFKGVQ